MLSPIRQSDPLKWYELCHEDFERLCCELHGVQEEIATCQLFGVRRQIQKGIDHIAQRKNGDGIEVGQSKCYKSFKEKDLKEAVEPFFHNIGYWKEKKVKRYILFIACDVQRTQIHEEKEAQRKCFESKGIVFELWSSRDIQRKLAPHHYIVERFVQSKELVEQVCGGLQQTTPSTEHYRRMELDFEAISSQRLRLSDALSRSKLERLESLREDYRIGKHKQSFADVRNLYVENKKDWELLDKFTKGQILRISALYTLNVEKDFNNATKIAAHAKKVDPEADDTVLRTMLTYHKDGPDAAIAVLDSLLTLDAINLHASLLLELGKSDEVLHFLDKLPDEVQPNPETRRIKALAFLVSGDLAKAHSQLDKAIAEKPNWYSIRVAKAIIDYWSTMSLAALKNSNPLIPMPISLDLVKRDQESLDLLRRSENEFHVLTLNNELTIDEKRMLLVWRLASLAMHQDRQDEAAKFCIKLLTKDPADPLVLRWALSRNYSVDRESIKSVMLGAIKGKIKNLDLVGVLIGFALEIENYYDAFRLLEKYKNQFKQKRFYDVWLFWRTHALIDAGKKLKDARNSAQLIEDPYTRHQLMIRIYGIQYKQSGDWKSLLDYLEALYNETDDGFYLFEACRLMASRKNYSYVLDRGDELISKIETPSALYLVVESARSENRFEKILNLLDRNAPLFSGGVLPDDLRKLRIYCQRKLGFLNEALGNAKSLSEEIESVDNLMTLMQAQIILGDLSGIEKSALRLLNMKDVKPLELLRAADIVQLQDSRLAQILWEKAVEERIDDPEVLKAAISIGYALGFDPKIDPLLERMAEFASKGQGDFQAVSLQDLLLMRKKRDARRQEIMKQYEGGELPIHFVSQSIGVSLAYLYHDHFSQCRDKPAPFRQLPLLARHGSRKLQDYKKIEFSKWKLHLDISTLILAAELEVLEIMEHAFGKLCIPSSTQLLLLNEMKMLGPSQPSRIEQMKKIERLIKLGKLSVLNIDAKNSEGRNSFADAMGSDWIDVLNYAKKQNGYLADFLPLHSNDIKHAPVNIPIKYSKIITGAKGIIKALHHEDLIDDIECSEALERISDVVINESDSPLPKTGNKLILMSNLPETLAKADVLDAVSHHFQVLVQKTDIDEINAELSRFDRNKKLLAWLDQLRNHLRDGIEGGLYEIIPQNDIAKAKLQDEEEKFAPAFQLLFELLTFSPRQGDVILYDDRHLTSYSNNNGAPIIGLLDIFAALRELNKIDQETYFAKLIELRKGNMRYIPLSKEEIFYHLNKAKINNRQVIETPELSILRRYWAACLLDTARLQIPPKPGKPKHEVGFIVSSCRAILDAILECWTNEDNKPELVDAYSDWVLHNLHTGLFGARHFLPDPDPQSDRIDLIGMDLGSLISSAIGLSIERKEGKRTAQSRYLSWLSSRLIFPRLKADPQTASAAANVIRSFCESPINRVNNSKTDDIQRYLFRKFLLNVPKKIIDELHQDADFMAKVGLRSADFILIENVSFLSDQYWNVAAKVVNGRSQKIFSYDPRIEFKIQLVKRAKNGHIILKISDKESKHPLTFDDPLLGILSNDSGVRLETLKNSRYMLNLDTEELKGIQRDIVKIQNPVSRINYILSIRNKSAAFYFEKLNHGLQKRDNIEISELLPPSPESLLKYFRLNESDFESSEDLAAGWIRAIDNLLSNETLNKVLDRIVCIPIRLPENLFDTLEQLEQSKLRDILLNAEKRWSSPISILHLIDVALHFARNDKVLFNVAKRSIERLWDKESGKTEFHLFTIFLKHFETEFSKWQKYRDMPVAARLFSIWAHSAQLHNMFQKAGADIETLAESIESKTKSISYTLFEVDLNYFKDVLNPSYLRQSHIIYHALGLILKIYDNSLIDSLGIKEKVGKSFESFLKGENADMLGLLSDTKLHSNSLNSFLGGDRENNLECLVGKEIAENYSSTFLREAAQKSIIQISKDYSHHPAWTILTAVVDSMPLYDDLKDEFLSFLSNLDLISLYESNPLTFAIVLPMVGAQVGYFGNKLLFDKFIDEILKVAKKISENINSIEKGRKENTEPSNEDILMFLVEAAYKISLHQGEKRKASKFFSDLVEKLFRISPLLAGKFRYPLWLLVTNLPANQIHGLWRLLLISRAL